MATLWKHSFEIPFVENLHRAIHAFLRTSEFGGWEVDETMPSDSYVLNYRRGKATPPPGKFRYIIHGAMGETYAAYVRRCGWRGWNTNPMQLTVRLRPLPADNLIRILVEHSLVGPHADLMLEIAGIRLSDSIQHEVNALAAYLKHNYQLPALPEINRN